MIIVNDDWLKAITEENYEEDTVTEAIAEEIAPIETVDKPVEKIKPKKKRIKTQPVIQPVIQPYSPDEGEVEDIVEDKNQLKSIVKFENKAITDLAKKGFFFHCNPKLKDQVITTMEKRFLPIRFMKISNNTDVNQNRITADNVHKIVSFQGKESEMIPNPSNALFLFVANHARKCWPMGVKRNKNIAPSGISYTSFFISNFDENLYTFTFWGIYSQNAMTRLATNKWHKLGVLTAKNKVEVGELIYYPGIEVVNGENPHSEETILNLTTLAISWIANVVKKDKEDGTY